MVVSKRYQRINVKAINSHDVDVDTDLIDTTSHHSHELHNTTDIDISIHDDCIKQSKHHIIERINTTSNSSPSTSHKYINIIRYTFIIATALVILIIIVLRFRGTMHNTVMCTEYRYMY